MIKYNISFVDKNNLRVLLGPNQGRYFKKTHAEAQNALQDLPANSSTERLAGIYGKQAVGTFRVDPFECYASGDAKKTIVDIGQQEPCPRCGVMHAAGEYVARPDLAPEDKRGGVPHASPDIHCTCGALLRHSVNASGWVWRIL